jgi:hypothetical protein
VRALARCLSSLVLGVSCRSDRFYASRLSEPPPPFLFLTCYFLSLSLSLCISLHLSASLSFPSDAAWFSLQRLRQQESTRKSIFFPPIGGTFSG